MNPYKTMRLWIKWEMMDIQAINDAVEMRSQIEQLKLSKIKKRENHQKELEQLNQGKSSLKTFFSSKEGKVNRITELTHKISNGEKEIDSLDLFLKIIVLQINQAAIPYFKRDKVAIYNDLLNVYSQQHINNAQSTTDVYNLIIKSNTVFQEESPMSMTKSIHQLE